MHNPEKYFGNEKINSHVIKVSRINENILISSKLLKSYATLLDTYSKEAYGGTGTTFSLKSIMDKSNKLNLPGKIFIAGGLNSENIKEIISKVKPFCIDICSAAESTLGKKDNVLIKEIMDIMHSININHKNINEKEVIANEA